MFTIDILWRVGFILSNPSPLNFCILTISIAAYVWRALFEEKFLQNYAEYRDYMQQVKYRFIPGLF
ncbi:methyltransferase family protein [candidate division CSSED10-310 bacterium]|uniref:Methyltransferase family protein n=1 Tax=candidate division CSSED10-310 bacterium TaxID=2855610 RepID=A0ABV6Z0N1_UNCC1